jgi:hypothetical protein
MLFVLTKERQEAERRRIEAQGIADFQRTARASTSACCSSRKGRQAALCERAFSANAAG